MRKLNFGSGCEYYEFFPNIPGGGWGGVLKDFAVYFTGFMCGSLSDKIPSIKNKLQVMISEYTYSFTSEIHLNIL